VTLKIFVSLMASILKKLDVMRNSGTTTMAVTQMEKRGSKGVRRLSVFRTVKK
jgi:hypothetical protein